MLIDVRGVMQELQLPLGNQRQDDLLMRAVSRFEQKGEYQLSELLAYSGEEFVDVAYRAVLRRTPDAEGKRAYVTALRSGRLCKVRILGALRSSGEGLHAGVPIHGLRLAYFIHRMFAKPLVGRPLRWLTSLVRLDRVPRSIEELEVRLAERDDRLERQVGDQAADMREELQRQVSSSAHSLRRSMARNEGEATRRMDSVIDRMNMLEARLEAGQQEVMRQGQCRGARGASDEDLAGMYVRLEEAFRGSRDMILRRSEVYLPYAEQAAADAGSRKVLDLGCGRGELLGLMAANGYECRGIDLNPMFVDENIKAGLDVALLDVLTALEVAEPSSLALITSIHLVEHLPVDVLVRLMDLAFIALKPGGKLILETPNPQNLRTSIYYFYFDPTHRNPIPPPLLSWMASDRGFVDVTVDLLEDGRFEPEVARVAGDEVGADQINRFVDLLSVSPDYAVIATKPF